VTMKFLPNPVSSTHRLAIPEDIRK